MALQGTLDTFALPDVLRLLAATRKSGRLSITGAVGTGSVWVDEGSLVGVEAPHAPHATAAVDALFELLRFQQGSFAFEAEVVHSSPGAAVDPEILLAEAEALLAEWREIEAVVPSMDAWVTLRRALTRPKVSVSQELWTTIVAIGSGATVSHMCDELGMAELPLSRSVRDLSELGLVDIEASAPTRPVETAPADAPTQSPPAAPVDQIPEPIVVSAPDLPAVDTVPALPEVSGGTTPPPADEAGPVDEPLPEARPLRARRAKGAAHLSTSTEPEHFVPLDLPGQGAQPSYDPISEPVDDLDETGEGGSEESVAYDADGVATALPGLTRRAAEPAEDEMTDGPSRRLPSLHSSAADADSADEPETVPDLGSAGRSLLVKLRSSVKG